MKAKIDRPAPKSANEVLHNTRDDHNWTRSDEDLNSTGGLQRAIKAQWHAIQALADYIDGVATGTTTDDGAPIKNHLLNRLPPGPPIQRNRLPRFDRLIPDLDAARRPCLTGECALGIDNPSCPVMLQWPHVIGNDVGRR